MKGNRKLNTLKGIDRGNGGRIRMRDQRTVRVSGRKSGKEGPSSFSVLEDQGN